MQLWYANKLTFRSQITAATMNYHNNKLQYIELDANKDCIKYVDLLAVKLGETTDALQKMAYFYDNLIKDKIVAAIHENQKFDAKIHAACWDEVEVLKVSQETTKQSQESYIKSCDTYLEAHRNHLMKSTSDSRENMIAKKEMKQEAESLFKRLYVI